MKLHFSSSEILANCEKELTISLTTDNTIRPFSDIEQEVIAKAVEYCDGNVVKAAKLLGIGRTTIYRKRLGDKSPS
ncbi:helix-turn-helix domain-containing protein [Candidatus Parabeggiatoa sp. HSG14]|uniref:helix-turn-helix domain-containing protein n=1 Tax=Candidatus Parabeggiatoa sp. HSG14 TaxID=3055593 RepID=UPI0025A85152|nr:helix-turn-helix domain-containing protein [Thiotrichales bacterium HSG14]